MVRFRAIHWLLVCMIVAPFIPACSKPDEGKVPFKPPATQARLINSTSMVSTSIKIPNMDTTQTQTTKMNMTAVPAEPDGGGNISVATTFDYMSNEQSGGLMPGGGMDMSGLDRAIATAVRGKTITAQVTPDGHVISVSGTDEVIAAVVEGVGTVTLPDGIGDDVKGQIEAILKQQFSEEQMKGQIEAIVLPRPLEKLDPGVTWQRQSKLNLGPFPFTANYTYTVNNRTEGVVTVDEAATFTFDPSGGGLFDLVKQAAAQMGEMSVNVSGTGTGTYQLDEATGWASSYKGTAALKGDVKVGPLSAPLDVTIESDFQSYYQ